jgi:hypothetical protein
MSTNDPRWTEYGITQADFERAQQRAAEERERLGPTPEEIDRELRELPDSAIDRIAGYAPNASEMKRWVAMDLDERRGIRAINEQACRRRVTEQEQARKADEAKREAQRAKAMAAEIAMVKAQARQSFPGTAAEFEKAWPGILAEWQKQQALRGMGLDAVVEQKRKQYQGDF